MSAFLFFRIQLFMINFAEIFIPIMDKDLFKTIDTVISKERLYAQANLMREDVMQRFSIGRHHLNDQLNAFADDH